jgi:predicted aspartyl protease
LGIKKPEKFIVDTGSVHTTIPETRARELGIDLEKLETYKVKLKMGGIGGGSEARMLGG